MDVEDVSHDPEYLPFLHAEEEAIHNAPLVEGRRPVKKLLRAQAIAGFNARMRIDPQKSPTKKRIQCSYVRQGYPPCMSPLSDLKKVMIDDLTLETHHRGSYIVLRTITPADTLLGPSVMVEDEDQGAVLLELTNMTTELSAEPHLLDEGTVLLVKEPYLRLIADRGQSIRVDHRSDLVFVPEHDSYFPLSWLLELDVAESDWKVRGDDLMNKGVYHLAIECYCQALKSSPSDEETLALQANQILASLKDGQFDAVVNGAMSINLNSNNLDLIQKILLCRAQALYKLRRFQEAYDLFKLLDTVSPGKIAIETAVFQCSARVTEEKTGKYPFMQMQQEASTLGGPRLNHATHIGPVAVRPTASHGRGLFTTGPVKAGDLLLCERAFFYAFPLDDSDNIVSLLINAQAKAMTLGTPAYLIDMILHSLYKNPSLIPTITDLYQGSCESVGVSEVDGRPVVDPFLVENIVWLNCFACPVVTRDSHADNVSNMEAENTYEHFTSSGIWPMASNINHSCFANSRRSFIGDMMIVRATQDLAPDTEITFWYQSPFGTQIQNKGMDLPRWGFECSCSICQDYQNTKPLDMHQRRKLVNDLSKLPIPIEDAEILKIDLMLCDIARTYQQPASEVPRLHMYPFYLKLARVYAARGERIMYVEWVMKAMESLGYIIEGGKLTLFGDPSLTIRKWGLMLDELVYHWLGLACAYHSVAPVREAQAKEYARITYRACVGEDETFEQTAGVRPYKD